MNILEMKEKIRELKEEARSFVNNKNVKEAKEKMEELRELKEALKIAEELEKEEVRKIKTLENRTVEGEKKMTKVNEMRAITKAVLGKELAQEERAAITSTGHEAILPKEYLRQVDLLKKGFGSLKEHCNVIPVTKDTGSMAVVDLDQNELADLTEGSSISDGTLATTKIDFDCKKVGLIQTLSSEIVEDAEVELENIIKDNFVNIAVIKENKDIITAVDTMSTKVEGTSATHVDLQKIMDTQNPFDKFNMVVLASIEGYAYLKGATDKQGRNLNLVTLGADGKEYFNGKELITFDSSLLGKYNSKPVFYVLNMKQAVKFFDRKNVSIARSAEAGFADDTVKVRVLERYCVKEGTKRSVKRLVIGGEM